MITQGVHSATVMATTVVGGNVSASSSTDTINISVFDTAAGWNGATTGTFGDGTVLDYAFYDDSGAYPTLGSYTTGAATLIGATTGTNNPSTLGNGSNIDWANIWTTNDPLGFTSTANFDGNSVPTGVRTSVTGSVDVSGLSSGTVYLIYGTFDGTNTLTASLSGSGVPNVQASDTSTVGSNNRAFITSFAFTTDNGDYDTLTYSYTDEDADGSRARFIGIVVDGITIPEPSSSALLASLAIGLMFNRRRK